VVIAMVLLYTFIIVGNAKKVVDEIPKRSPNLEWINTYNGGDNLFPEGLTAGVTSLHQYLHSDTAGKCCS
jgi:hypothetical protein